MLTELNSQRDALEWLLLLSVRNVYLHGKVCGVVTMVFFSNCSFKSILLELNKLALERILQEELSVKVVLKSSLWKKWANSQFPQRSACFPLLFFTSWRITAQLKFTVFYGSISMKERCGAPLLGLAKSIC